MKRLAPLALLAALCCLLGGSWLIANTPDPLSNKIDAVVNLRNAEDCVPRDHQGKNCVQHTIATVTKTEYATGEPAGALWEAHIRLPNGSTAVTSASVITQDTKPGDTLPVLAYNGKFRYVEGHAALAQRVDDTLGLYYLAAAYALGFMLVLYGLITLLYVALNLPARVARIERVRFHEAPSPPFKALVWRGAVASGTLFGVGIAINVAIDQKNLYVSTMAWTLPWIYVALGLTLEVFVLRRYLKGRNAW